jgi:large subunit ribosomal protein L24
MAKKQKLSIKVGDPIVIISGFYKDKTGKIIVKGINLKFKHVKPNTENEIGEIKQFEAPIHHSNVKLNVKDVS